MYLPAAFSSFNPQHALRIMREHPLAHLIAVDESGFPMVSHCPLHVAQLNEEGAPAVLSGHLAAHNPQVPALKQQGRALVTFMGPQAYMSPAVYPDLQRVPTWSYLAVHAQVSVRWLDEQAAKDALLKQLIADHEPPYAQQWRRLPEEYTDTMLRHIVAFELDIEVLQTALKLNQHRPQSHAAMHERWSQGNAEEQALARWMRDLGLLEGHHAG